MRTLVLCAILFGSWNAVWSQGERGYGVQFHQDGLPRNLGYEDLRSLGVERVVFRVFENMPEQEMGVTFKNRYRRPTKDLSQENGSLRKRLSIDSWAWMNTRSMAWEYRKDLMDPAEWPGKRAQEDARLDLFNPAVVELIRGYYQDLARSGYQGILIQDDLILKRYEGLSLWGRKKISQWLGLPGEFMKPCPEDPADAVNWRRIKLSQVNRVLAQIVGDVHESRPGTRVGVNVYYECALKPKNGEDWYAQSIPELVWTGVDEIHLMAYHRQMMKELGWSFGEMIPEYRRMLDQALEMAGSEHLVVKIQTRDWDNAQSIPAEELKAVVMAVPQKVRLLIFTPVKEEEWKSVREVVAWDRQRTR